MSRAKKLLEQIDEAGVPKDLRVVSPVSGKKFIFKGLKLPNPMATGFKKKLDLVMRDKPMKDGSFSIGSRDKAQAFDSIKGTLKQLAKDFKEVDA